VKKARNPLFSRERLLFFWGLRVAVAIISECFYIERKNSVFNIALTVPSEETYEQAPILTNENFQKLLILNDFFNKNLLLKQPFLI
jgi:hypothetical protein